MKRIYLSPPLLDGREGELLLQALDSNWITTLGPQVDAFEKDMCTRLGVDSAVALSSGTAALHLALLVLGVGSGDEVLCSTLTFAATANAIRYCGAAPVFIDSNSSTWNMDPALLEDELSYCQRKGKLPKAVIVVDLYGQCADYNSILEICSRYDVPVIEDAAEALGATYHGKPAGSFGALSVLSFNGNKIITTSGGGMLLSHQREYADEARYLSTQARDPAPHYEHSHVGYNYRLSNLLAAVGRAQLESLDRKVAKKRAINQYYRDTLADLPGVTFMPEIPFGRSTFWLSCITINPDVFGASADDIRLHLEAHDIEARPVWKPMHMQPVFRGTRIRGGTVARELFRTGLCLPSGCQLTDHDLARIAGLIRSQAVRTHDHRSPVRAGINV